MHIDDARFGKLREWNSYTDDELAALWSKDSHTHVEYFVKRLGGAQEKSVEVCRQTFVSLIRTLNSLYAVGSRQLGEAILEGLDRRDAGDKSGAIRRFESFREKCQSECYREVADFYIKQLRE